MILSEAGIIGAMQAVPGVQLDYHIFDKPKLCLLRPMVSLSSSDS